MKSPDIDCSKSDCSTSPLPPATCHPDCQLLSMGSRREDRNFIKLQTTVIVFSFMVMSIIGMLSMNRLRVSPAEVLSEVKALQAEVLELKEQLEK